MGAWGTGLFQNDAAADLAEDFKEIVALSDRLDAAVETLRAKAGISDPPEEADDTGFWLALRDLMHQYGLEHPETEAMAESILKSGDDLRFLEDLDMSPKDLKARAKLLDGLPEKWATPPKRKKRIPVLKQEPFLLDVGEVCAYPTMGYNPDLVPIGTVDEATYNFVPDAENAFVVMARARVFHDLEARYFVVPLLLFNQNSEIELKDCFDAMVPCEIYTSFHKLIQPAGGWTHFSKKDLKVLKSRNLGTVDPDAAALAEFYGERFVPPTHRYEYDSQVLWMRGGIFDDRQRGGGWVDDDVEKPIPTLRTLVKNPPPSDLPFA